MQILLQKSSKVWAKRLALVGFILMTFNSQSEQQTRFVSDVIGVEEKMLYPKYWTNRITDAGTELMSVEQILHDNQRLFKTNKLMTSMESFPETLTAEDITKSILSISSRPKSNRFYAEGRQLIEADYAGYEKDLNLDSVPDQKTIALGMIVRRTNMRTFPTAEGVYKTATDFNLDRFQETALFPTQVVALLHESLDKKWWFAVSYNYSAWLKKEDVAIGSRLEIFDYKNASQFIVVTDNKIFTSFNPVNKNISEVQLEMGTVLPLVNVEDIPTTLDGQNTYTSYVISLPVRKRSGKLIFQPALISRSEDVHKGFLPYTQENIIKQSFKFLGERYGWGHSFNARDCTGFVGEVFKSFGILMPRNSGDQGRSEQGENSRVFDALSNSEKLVFLNQLEVGDLIYIPGHVMMVLGFHGDKPYVIHDVSGLSYYNQQGDYYKSMLNGVSITPLLPLQLSPEKSYIDTIYTIKKIK